MTLCNPNSWIRDAQRNRYAIGAFNANTMEQVQAIALAAQAENAPAMIQVSHNALLYIGSGSAIRGLRYMGEIGRIAAESVSVPIALHLDHANADEVIQAVSVGFSSVMFDGGELPIDENIAITKRLVEMAHSVGAFVEAELGAVPKPDATGFTKPADDLTDPEEAAHFVEATGIDALAIALGSVHGVKDKHVTIDLERLKAIRALVDAPLVLHGSSGVTDEYIAAGIELGLCKVNIATQLNKGFTEAVRAVLNQDAVVVDPRKYLAPGRDAMIDVVRERIRFVGAANRVAAAEAAELTR